MVWYTPALSPIQSAIQQGHVAFDGELPDLRKLRIPLKYLANLLTAGVEQPVIDALNRMYAMRIYQRSKHVDGKANAAVLKQVGLTAAQVEEMYRTMAIANYEDRFVVPSSHREYAEDAFHLKGECGFSFGNGCGNGISDLGLFGSKRPRINADAERTLDRTAAD